MTAAGADPGAAQRLVLAFEHIGAGDVARVGGKAANLGELTRAGLPVPPGFCVTTEAFRRFVAADPDLETAVYARLAALAPDDVEGVRAAGEAVRARLLRLPVPEAVEAAVVEAWRGLGETGAYAVRSSATAEDLPGASFAGQQDTFLNVRGRRAIVDAVRRAWVSLFTDRAILYRAKQGFDHRAVALSAVVQRMVMPEVSGILFTADPLSGRRHITSIDAGFGLGEALVSGIVSADLYRVDTRAHEVVGRRIADKALAIRPLADGGTARIPLEGAERSRPSLTDGQALALAALGERIEAHYGAPQDIEWAIDGVGKIFIVQARPITSLYPLPAPPPDPGTGLHVYASFGHVQVMTDAISPMGRSLLRTLLPFGKAGRPGMENPWLVEAGGRLYVDATPVLRIPPLRHAVLRALRVADPLIAEALREVTSRAEFADGARPIAAHAVVGGALRWLWPVASRLQHRLWLADPDTGPALVQARCDALVETARRRMANVAPGAGRPGATLDSPRPDAIEEERRRRQESKDRLEAGRHALGTALPELLRVMPPVMGAGYAGRAILARLAGPRANPADLDAIVRGLEGNVTTEMDLAVGDLADLARSSSAVSARLAAGAPETAIADIADIAAQAGQGAVGEDPARGADRRGRGGAGEPDGAHSEAAAFLDAWQRFIERYGMRGPSEIDVARPRWAEAPASLVAMVAGALRAEPGAHRAHQRRMALAGDAAGERLVAAAGHGVLGPVRARLARRCLRLVRRGIPMREHPKFAIVQLLGLLRAALVECGDALVAQGRLERAEDVFWLGLDELLTGIEDDAGDKDDPAVGLREIVARRRAAEARFPALRPPRVMTSDGEIPDVRHAERDLPAGALPGAAASAGVVEGVARVVLDPTSTVLSPGEILVAPFTDPGWTPLFIHAAALVMEVGGLMTHGSVVAREYGIPAVVGVIDATARISSGQRLRVDGSRGFVEILEDGA